MLTRGPSEVDRIRDGAGGRALGVAPPARGGVLGPAISEEAVPARADQAPEDDQDETEDHLALGDLHDAEITKMAAMTKTTVLFTPTALSHG